MKGTDTKHTIRGIYFKINVSTIGTGATKQDVRAKIFCEARQIGDDRVEVRYLGFHGRPSGIQEFLKKEEFLRDFMYYANTYPIGSREQKSIERHMAMADEHLRRKEYFAAEYEYEKVLRLDEENARAYFGKGLALMERGDHEKARDIFTSLARIEALFLEENKHIFNEFGIRLRQLSLCDEAVSHYHKAMSISPDDEHLYFNLARAYFEKQEIEQARKWATIAIRSDPNFREARELLQKIDKARLPNSRDGDSHSASSG
jgi:tetratricopeptide (TPR) repeat protein